MQKRVLDPAAMDETSVYKILAGAVVPRPIGLLSTVSAAGIRNVAPFSFFNALSPTPPLVCASISRLRPGDRMKDTLANIVETREFVVNIVDEELAKAQDICAKSFEPEVDEFEMAGITPMDSLLVRPPCVRESLINFECRAIHIMPLPGGSAYTLVIGQVCMMHVHPEVLEPNGRIDLQRLAPIGRLVGDGYCHVKDMFTLDHDTFKVRAGYPGTDPA